MALSGSCPGTVFGQVALGVRSGFFALQGAALAGIIWSGFLGPYLDKGRDSPQQQQRNDKLTLQEYLGGEQLTALAAFESLCALVVGYSTTIGSPSGDVAVSPVVGGLLLGFVQLASILIRKSLVSVSTSFVELGDWVWWLLRGASGDLPNTGTLEFALGIAAGSWASGSYFPFLVEGASTEVTPGLAVLGGCIMVLGSRIAGGCTSGHVSDFLCSFSPL